MQELEDSLTLTEVRVQCVVILYPSPLIPLPLPEPNVAFSPVLSLPLHCSVFHGLACSSAMQQRYNGTCVVMMNLFMRDRYNNIIIIHIFTEILIG